MRRNQQSNEIRTNILFEFSVVGENAVREAFSAVFDAATQVESKGVVCRVVGVSLKKPTANGIYLTKHTLDVKVSQESMPLIISDTETELESDEVEESENEQQDDVEDTSLEEVSQDD